MSTYIGQVKIGAESAAVGSTLYGICATAASSETKSVSLDSFDAVLHGVTIFVKFNNGNSATSNVKLIIGSGTYDVVGNCVCSSGEVLSFTFDETDNGVLTNDSTKWRWITNGHAIIPATATPSAIGTAAVGSSAKYAKEDHVHGISLATGDSDGQVKIAGTNVTVKGLKSAAYTESTDYATSSHNHDSVYAPINNPTFTGTVTLPGAPSTNNEAATKAYVDGEISTALTGSANAMIFKGTMGTNGTVTSVPTNSYGIGDTYRIITAGTYAGAQCEVGDLIIAIHQGPATGNTVIENDWTVAQGNLDGTVIGPSSSTNNHVALFNGISGKLIKDSGLTLGTSVPSDAVFTDTTYTITNGSAYTAHTLATGIANDNSTIASVSQGVLTLASGITFTTSAVNASLNSSTAGPSS